MPWNYVKDEASGGYIDVTWHGGQDWCVRLLPKIDLFLLDTGNNLN